MSRRKKSGRKKRNLHQLGRARPKPPPPPEPEPERGVDLIGDFVAEHTPKDPQKVSLVLAESLSGVRSILDLVAGRWVLLAPHYVEDAWVPGYRAGRVYQTLERFARWLHARGYIGEWARDHLLYEIEEGRYAHGLRRDRPPERGMERVVQKRERDEVIRGFAASLTHPVERQLAPQAIRVLVSHLDLQLGDGDDLVFGAIDADAFVQDTLEESRAEELESDCALFTILAAFYRWLGEQGRLDRARASTQAAKLSAAALGTQLALRRTDPSAGRAHGTA